MDDALPLGRPLLLRADALAAGLDDRDLARAVRRGQLTRVRPGAYLDPSATLSANHALVLATAAVLRDGGAVSHVSAAVLHGLPLWHAATDRVHVTRSPPAAGSGSARVHLHVARLPEDDLTTVDGATTTSLARAVVDLGRSLPFESALVAADAALASGQVTPAHLDACLARMGPVPGSRRASRVVAFADGRSESVGESRSRVLMHRLGLPVPDLQVRLLRPDRSVIARCDFGWRDHRTVGEFDGRVKYRGEAAGPDPGEVVFREKRREDDIRDSGWEVARWTWADLRTPAVVERRIRRAFARGGRSL
ncbi:Transcriptional regulator, AbiEi antitoxin, Type IV TA system [Geodermatophilus obscurus]|uniref:Transcriptional regulator, AbiEi antitoxin, Type IV TA system n=1 Tax=Geodermatophilus obscurus TaxID=1861 RepID=A0A1I5DLH5_9ACTN|nr:type IV toxin-antitoxin system AbiEi family antitoxin domain-containing protein [Geodermatophilus obscurus]SFN99651.1 Transcriptional regulator, AbiEi antitoxin, Type IV TA system [Geodermatophilus obscurus]